MWIEKYGNAVLDGELIACRKIKRLYERLLDQIANPGEYHFDASIAARHIDFIEAFCKQSQGKIGTPLKLELFQKALLEAVFGFVDDNNLRQYNEALTIIGRKNGKTTLMAAVELDLLINDQEGAPEIYNIATAMDQAKKAFDECHRMIQHSPALSKHIRKRQSDLYCPINMGIVKALASNTNSLDGLNAHGVIIDELSAVKNRDIYDLMKQSMGARKQPLLFEITTSGFVRHGIYDSQYEYASGVLDGTIDNPHFLPVIYELDSPSEWRDEKNWIKANPGLGTIKSVDFLRECVQKAKDDPSFYPTVLVKDFNVKQTTSTAWLHYEDTVNEETFDYRAFDYCVGGMDAADTIDLNAAKAVMVRPGDPKVYVQSMYWLPETVLEHGEKSGNRRERDAVPYKLWADQGLLRIWPGAKVDKICFFEWFCELRDSGLYPLYIGYDPWHIDDSLLRMFAAEFGENCMVPVRQGVRSCSAPMMQIQADLLDKKIVYNNNPIDQWCLLNSEIKADINGNIQLIKGLDRKKRIDGTAALIDAYRVLMDHDDEARNLNKEA